MSYTPNADPSGDFFGHDSADVTVLDVAENDPRVYSHVAPEVFGQPSPYSTDAKCKAAGEYPVINCVLNDMVAEGRYMPGMPPVLKHFSAPPAYMHADILRVAKLFSDAAAELLGATHPGPEQSAGLRKLLEARDCFMRAALP